MAIQTRTWAVFLLLALLSSSVAEAEASHAVFPDLQSLDAVAERAAVGVDDPLRTGFHFRPPSHWINGNCVQ
jgi:beta-fructofuranosidase